MHLILTPPRRRMPGITLISVALVLASVPACATAAQASEGRVGATQVGAPQVGAIQVRAAQDEAIQGPWVEPLPMPPAQVVRAFTAPTHPFGPGHRGVDLSGHPGLPVRAAGRGVVAFAGLVAGRPVVAVDHAGGLRTTYEPVRPSVSRGQVVASGAVLGALATAASHCLPAACLHWGLRQGAVYLDPMSLVGGWSVRLLPLGGTGPAPAARRATAAGAAGAAAGARAAAAGAAAGARAAPAGAAGAPETDAKWHPDGVAAQGWPGPTRSSIAQGQDELAQAQHEAGSPMSAPGGGPAGGLLVLGTATAGLTTLAGWRRRRRRDGEASVPYLGELAA